MNMLIRIYYNLQFVSENLYEKYKNSINDILRKKYKHIWDILNILIRIYYNIYKEWNNYIKRWCIIKTLNE